MRWLNLSGFCLRPGFGVPGDDVRVNDLRTIASNELVFVDDLQCQVGMLVLLRRIVGGINASEQHALYRKHTSGDGSKKKGRVNRQLDYERWRLVASLEHLLAGTRGSQPGATARSRVAGSRGLDRKSTRLNSSHT